MAFLNAINYLLIFLIGLLAICYSKRSLEGIWFGVIWNHKLKSGHADQRMSPSTIEALKVDIYRDIVGYGTFAGLLFYLAYCLSETIR